jgi:hypothetical protein
VTPGRRETIAVATIAACALAGVAFDLAAGDVAAPPARSSTAAFVERATFCPPPVADVDGHARLAAASAGGERLTVSIEPGAPARLARGRVLARTVESSSAVTGHGARVVASSAVSFSRPVAGAAAARCSVTASDEWYFPAGSSALGSDARLLLFNPFGDEAVARILFFTAGGIVAKANLSDVAVPAGQSVEISVNDYVLRRQLLSAAVLVKRGRVVAWRALLASGRSGAGAHMSLGAPRPSDTWYFPAGALGGSYDERVTVLNPEDEEALLTITLVTERRVVQPPRLVEVAVPPESARTMALAELAGAPRSPRVVSAWVSSANEVGIVAERTVRWVGGARRGVASEVGVTHPARRWVAGPALLRASHDELHVMNPGTRDASVTVTLLRPDGPPLEPGPLRDVEVPAGLRVTLRLDRWTGGAPVAASVVADSEVVVERSGYSAEDSDAAALMGTAITPSALGR